eukprot:238403_1
MASENCKPTAKCLGIATLVIVGLLFFYNVALKGTSPNFDLKLNESGDQMQVTLTNIDMFPAFDAENETSTGFDIVLKAKKDDKGGEPVTVSNSIPIVPKDEEQKTSVVFDHMDRFVGGSVTVTYFPEDKGFASSTNKVPTKSNSKNREKRNKREKMPLDNQQSDSYDIQPMDNDDDKPLATNES